MGSTVTSELASIEQFAQGQQQVFAQLKQLASSYVGDLQQYSEQQRKCMSVLAAENDNRIASMQVAFMEQMQQTMRTWRQQQADWFAEQERAAEQHRQAFELEHTAVFHDALLQSTDSGASHTHDMLQHHTSHAQQQQARLATLQSRALQHCTDSKATAQCHFDRANSSIDDIEQRQTSMVSSVRSAIDVSAKQVALFTSQQQQQVADAQSGTETQQAHLSQLIQDSQSNVQQAEGTLTHQLSSLQTALCDYSQGSQQWFTDGSSTIQSLMHQQRADHATGATPARRKYEYITRLSECPSDAQILERRLSGASYADDLGAITRSSSSSSPNSSHSQLPVAGASVSLPSLSVVPSQAQQHVALRHSTDTSTASSLSSDSVAERHAPAPLTSRSASSVATTRSSSSKALPGTQVKRVPRSTASSAATASSTVASKRMTSAATLRKGVLGERTNHH
jgi:hypothetical protein